jgi:hypothetical protein
MRVTRKRVLLFLMPSAAMGNAAKFQLEIRGSAGAGRAIMHSDEM